MEELGNNWQLRSPGKWFINCHPQSPEVSVEVSQDSMQGGEGLKGRGSELLSAVFNPSSFIYWISESPLLLIFLSQ